MKTLWLPALSFAAIVAMTSTRPTQAATFDVRFTGAVASQSGTSFTTGGAIAGEFIYNGDSNRFGLFTIGGVNAPAGLTPSASITPDRFSALFQLQSSPVQQGGIVNTTFGIDLEGLNKFPATATAATLLGTGAALTSNLDLVSNPNSLFPSSFEYYIANADGTNIRRVTANLATIQIAVPEPASLALVTTALFALGLRRRR